MKMALIYALMCIGSTDGFVCFRMHAEGPERPVSDTVRGPRMVEVDCAYPEKAAERLGVPVCTL
jgi:hypothetical protein